MGDAGQADCSWYWAYKGITLGQEEDGLGDKSLEALVLGEKEKPGLGWVIGMEKREQL